MVNQLRKKELFILPPSATELSGYTAANCKLLTMHTNHFTTFALTVAF